MKRSLALMILSVAVVITGCEGGPGARITRNKPAPAPVARSEPIFYNGKTYQLDFRPGGAGIYDMTVSGMTAKQQKDAIAVATSSLGYFACPDSAASSRRNRFTRLRNGAFRRVAAERCLTQPNRRSSQSRVRK
jgi:hypothetical protein